MTRIVVTVLASGDTVQVDDDLQSVFTSPGYGLVEIWKLTLEIGFA